MKLFLHALLPVAFVLAACGDGNAANPNIPHKHQGKITPYDGAPPEVPLSDQEAQKVSGGEAVYKQVEYAGGGRAVAVFKVNASPKTVWSVISDFPKMPEWIGGKLEKTEVYKREGDKIYVAFTLNLGMLMGRWTYYIEHNYPMEKEGWGTWKLDYSRSSDLDDSVGYWRVKEVPGTGESIVTYSVDIMVASWVPGWVKNMIVNDGLKEATSWVKVQSEKRAGH